MSNTWGPPAEPGAYLNGVSEQWVRQELSLSRLTLETVTSWVVAIRQHICHAAEAKELTPQDFACTLLGAVVGARAAAFFQVGDGAIVVRDNDSLSPVFWPDAGEYVNVTYFVTDEDALMHLHEKIWFSSRKSSLPNEVAMFSDGLQRLALVYESRTAYQPFFEPMFDTLRKADPTACDMLSDQLARFLGSSPVNERTDDDKTLVLASRKD